MWREVWGAWGRGVSGFIEMHASRIRHHLSQRCGSWVEAPHISTFQHSTFFTKGPVLHPAQQPCRDHTITHLALCLQPDALIQASTMLGVVTQSSTLWRLDRGGNWDWGSGPDPQ